MQLLKACSPAAPGPLHPRRRPAGLPARGSSASLPATSPQGEERMAGPLEGLRILEASGDVAVRYCGRLFAQLGASVETAIEADDTRIGFAGEAGRAYGRWLDQGKVRTTGEACRTGDFDLVIAGQDARSVAAAAE